MSTLLPKELFRPHSDQITFSWNEISQSIYVREKENFYQDLLTQVTCSKSAQLEALNCGIEKLINATGPLLEALKEELSTISTEERAHFKANLIKINEKFKNESSYCCLTKLCLKIINLVLNFFSLAPYHLPSYRIFSPSEIELLTQLERKNKSPVTIVFTGSFESSLPTASTFITDEVRDSSPTFRPVSERSTPND